jgi:hypothetical protein
VSERDRDEDEGPRRSWSEIDKLRDRPFSRRSASERRPRGAAAEARSRAATRQYLEKAGEALFSRDPGGARGEALARGIRAARGTPELAAACRGYLEEVGPPRDPALAGLFLEAPARDVAQVGLEALAQAVAEGRAALTPGMRTRLRMLARGPDDELAGAAEDLLGRL